MALTTGGRFRLPDRLRCDIGPFSRDCLAVFADRTGLREEAGAAWLFLRREDMTEEAYTLRVEADRVTVGASTERGVIQGLTELFLRLKNGEVPLCDIKDRPKYPHRGLSLDCVRHFFPIGEVEKILEQMALVKMNVLHFHLSDDQGWRIESLRFPELHRQSGDYYTREELRRLVAFASKRGIDIIPEIDLPGHTTAILAAYPELGCTGRQPKLATEGGIYNTILCAGQEEVFRFLDELLAEITELFPDERFHIGGDEAPKAQWSRCPHCRKRLEVLGETDFEALQTDFTRRVLRILESHGKRPICWNEALKGGLRDAITVQYWTEDGWEQLKQYIRAGRPWIYSSMFDTYLDYPYAMTPMAKLYRLRLPRSRGLLGLEAALWTEHISDPETLHRQLFPRLYALGELGWRGGHGSRCGFYRRMEAVCALGKAMGITPMPRDGWDSKGKKRQQEALDFFQKMNGGVLEDPADENIHKTEPSLRMMTRYVTRFFRLTDLVALAKLYFK